jgi:hypothetical protein
MAYIHNPGITSTSSTCGISHPSWRLLILTNKLNSLINRAINIPLRLANKRLTSAKAQNFPTCRRCRVDTEADSGLEIFAGEEWYGYQSYAFLFLVPCYCLLAPLLLCSSVALYLYEYFTELGTTNSRDASHTIRHKTNLLMIFCNVFSIHKPHRSPKSPSPTSITDLLLYTGSIFCTR